MVNKSAVFASDGQYSSEIMLLEFRSRRKWNFVSTCLVRLENLWPSANLMQLWLSTFIIIGNSRLILNSVHKFLSQIISWQVSASAMYSASVLDRETQLCFLQLQEIIPSPSLHRNPLLDFLSDRFSAQLASENAESLK